MIRRLYHVSCVSYNIKKQAMKLNKLLNPKSKRHWDSQMFVGDSLPSIKRLTKVQREPSKQGMHRLAMLNKMFMKHITDLMSTGTVSMNIVGRGIEISKVQVTPDLHTLNVFWVCKGDTSDEETEAVLNKLAGALRHELSTLRVMGEVPFVMFVKDKNEARLVELDRRLAIADYGEDYTPTDAGHLLKTEFTLDTKLSPEMKAKIKQLDEEIDIIEQPIPEMTNNVFGLDHDQIMSRLVAARRRSKEAWSNLEAESPVVSYRTIADAVPDDESAGNQRKELAEFLHKRQILQNKLMKQLKDTSQEWSKYEPADDQEHSDTHGEYDYEERMAEQLYDEEYYDKYDNNHTDILDKLKESKR